MFAPTLLFERLRGFARARCLLLLGAVLLPLAATGEVSRPSPDQLALAERNVEKLLVVDCLLPGQVRRLGTRMTYLSVRRPAKLVAEECGLRGGEYVMYDRADLATALSAWEPLAAQGDREAQTYMGEIYERGVGGQPPRYADAAAWYRKAAEQGHPRAMINLGFLYEKGLGVERDPARALSLYRKAAGLGDAIALEGGDGAAREQEVRALKSELEQTRRKLDEALRELERQRRDGQSELRELEKRIRDAAGAGDREAAGRLTVQLQERERELAARGREVEQLSAALAGYRKQLESLESETASLREQLAQARQRLADTEAELRARHTRAEEDQGRLDVLKSQLEAQRKAAAGADSEAVRRLEAQLGVREQELARQREEIARVEREAREYKAKLAALETGKGKAPQSAPAGGVEVALAPPSIQLIDPPVVLTRSPATITLRGRPTTRELVGRVTAPAGLLSFTVNDVSQGTDEHGMFKTVVPVTGSQTPVALVAVDRQGKRAELQFLMVPEAGTAVAAPLPPPRIPTVDFGRYHALIIGNQEYRQLPRLDTAIADAEAVGEVLRNKYGFRVTLLKNATRYEILSAMNKLRAELTERDNLLIYYAGHGEIDRANLRGHWLPVDAEPNSDANWISNVSITDILNAIAVKHAMIVADSCYSGTLTRSSIGQLDAAVSDEARIKWLAAIVQARVRTVLTSGGVQPVMDGGGGKHSVFAKSLLEVLTENTDALEAQRLYREVAARVLDRASRFEVEQRPEYAPLKFAGHESGDFLFVPMNLLARQ